MHKLFTLVTLLLIVFFESVAIAYDFRNVNWGATVKQVNASEKSNPTTSNAKTLSFKGTLAGLEVLVIYKFENGKLVGGGYINSEKHTNLTDYIEDYEKIKSLLEKKYGEPILDNVNWKNDLYKNNPQEWGMAIATGQLEYTTRWYTDRTYITIALNGDRYSVNHFLFYNDKSSVDKKTELESLDGL